MTFIEEFEKRAALLAELMKLAQDPLMAGGAPPAAPAGMDPMAAMMGGGAPPMGGGGMPPMGGDPMAAMMGGGGMPPGGDPMAAMIGGGGGMPPDPAMLEQLLGGAGTGAAEASEATPPDPGADGQKVLIKALDLVEKVVDLALSKDEVDEAPENAAATMLSSGAIDNVSPDEIMGLTDTLGQEPGEMPQLS